jgi:uncharacterized protein YeaO (DUF488 family)
MGTVRIKRVYDDPSPDDGRRVLVDRIWPRGISKERAQIDLWLKEVAPSTGLRKWFGHDPRRWDEFRQRYRTELVENPEPFEELVELVKNGPVTLVYSARDEEHNQAVALREVIADRIDP